MIQLVPIRITEKKMEHSQPVTWPSQHSLPRKFSSASPWSKLIGKRASNLLIWPNPSQFCLLLVRFKIAKYTCLSCCVLSQYNSNTCHHQCQTKAHQGNSCCLLLQNENGNCFDSSLQKDVKKRIQFPPSSSDAPLHLSSTPSLKPKQWACKATGTLSAKRCIWSWMHRQNSNERSERQNHYTPEV